MNEIEKVIAALENPNYDWRTIDGIAKDTKLSPEKVLDIIKTLENVIVRSSIPDEKERPIYTTRKHYRETHSLFNRYLSSAIGRIKP